MGVKGQFLVEIFLQVELHFHQSELVLLPILHIPEREVTRKLMTSWEIAMYSDVT